MRKLSLLAAMLVAIMTSFMATAADMPFDGSGTEDSPYLIKTKDDLIKLSELTFINAYNPNYDGCEGQFFKMTNDIDLEYDTDFKGICVTYSVGSTDHEGVASLARFKGVFDGGGHTVHRMKLSGMLWSVLPTETAFGTPHATNARKALAFIGRLGRGGVVMNLNIGADCEIESYKYTAGVVGAMFAESRIENCRNYADVKGYGQFVGGIVGEAQGGEIIECYNAGNILCGDAYAGGIAGRSFVNMIGCANTGNITEKQLSTVVPSIGCVGGISGCPSNGTISECLNTGTITGVARVGGIGGETRNPVRCINYGIIISEESKTAGGISGVAASGSFGPTWSGNYFDSQIAPVGAVASRQYTGCTASETAFLTAGELPSGYSKDIWDFTAGMYPVLAGFVDEPAVAAARRMVAKIPAGDNANDVGGPITLATFDGLQWSLNAGAAFKLQGNTAVPPTQPMTTADELIATLNGYTKHIPVKYSGGLGQEGPFKGQGTAAAPYILATKADLIRLSELTSTTDPSLAPGMDKFDGKYFKMTNDIDMEYDTAFKGISCAPLFTMKNFVKFCGVIDGDGHTIHRMKFDLIRWTVSPEEADGGLPTVDNDACHNETAYTAFVGRLGDGGIVRNLNIAADCEIVGFSPLAGVVATMDEGSRVENCRNYADILSYNSCAGGIAGVISIGATVSHCYNAGNITTGAIYAGGIAGNCDGVIENSANVGTVTGRQLSTNVPAGKGFFSNIGGIAGNGTGDGTKITNCVNAGMVYGEEQAGGICGSFALATSCLNYGTVHVSPTQTAKSGSLFGNKNRMGTKIPMSLYYDKQINRVRAVSSEDFTYNPGGGLDPIQSTNALLTTDLISGYGLMGLDDSVWQYDEGQYPVLKEFASEPKLAAARQIIAVMTPNNNAAMLTEPVTLRPAEGLTWSVNDNFVISGNEAQPRYRDEGNITATNEGVGLTKVITCIIYGYPGNPNSSIDDIAADKDVVATEWYNLNGVRVAKPEAGDGQIYIINIRYTDGSTKAYKLINR